MTDWKHAWRAAAWISVVVPALLVSILERQPADAEVEGSGARPGAQADAQKAPPTLGPAKLEKSSSCDCTVFPWPAACDKECGLVTGLVKEIARGHIVISVPVLRKGTGLDIGGVVGSGRATASAEDRTFVVSDQKSVQGLEPGKRVALIFRREDEKTVLRSIRQVEAVPAAEGKAP